MRHTTHQYVDNVLQFFPHAEGYVNNTVVNGTNVYNYVYNYTDHLGNVRVSYGVDPTTQLVKIMEENNYYPFGLKHKNYNMSQKAYIKAGSGTGLEPCIACPRGYQYKYNGKELQDELGLNMYDYGSRLYDPARAGWSNIDPLAEKMRRYSPYNYCFDNPLRFTDPDGMAPDDIHPTFQNDNAKQAYVSTVNNAMGGMYQITADPLINNGNVVMTSTGVQGPMTEGQQVFHDEYKSAVDSPATVNQTIVERSVDTTVGSWVSGKVDMADVAAFDKAGSGGATSAGAIIHETKEQLIKSEMGLKNGEMGNYQTNFLPAHQEAIKSENKVNGNTRINNDTFQEKNGSTTTQTITPNSSTGRIQVTKVNRL